VTAPRAPRNDFLVTHLEDEVVVYDPGRKEAHTLSRLASAVWNQSDGANSVEEVQRRASEEAGFFIDRHTVIEALQKLDRAGLLATNRLTRSITRREALGKAGRVGAALVVTPLVASTLVPMAAAAASICVGPGSPGSTAGATCGSTCQCLTTQTPSGPGAPRCVDFTALRGTSCGPRPTGYIPCNPGDVCVQLDSSHNLGLCYGACPTPTCSC
jgi:hypothetical protein